MEPALWNNKNNHLGFVMGAVVAKTLEPLLKKMVYGILSISALCKNAKTQIETWIGDFAVESQAMQIRKGTKREGEKIEKRNQKKRGRKKSYKNIRSATFVKQEYC